MANNLKRIHVSLEKMKQFLNYPNPTKDLSKETTRIINITAPINIDTMLQKTIKHFLLTLSSGTLDSYLRAKRGSAELTF